LDKISQKDIILEFYKKNPNRDIPHPEAVDWITTEYLKRTGNIFRDPDRGIRKLSQEGYLIKINKGVYRYDPDYVINYSLEDFSEAQKKEILKRDGYKCVVCGRGKEDGVELQVDHIKPKDKGGKATIDNGQTLCAQHNFQKKNYDTTEFAERLFKTWLELAKQNNDEIMVDFCSDVLEVYQKYHDIINFKK